MADRQDAAPGDPGPARGSCVGTREATRGLEPADPFITRQRRVRYGRPQEGTKCHEVPGKRLFGTRGCGHGNPCVPALAYPICTRHSELQTRLRPRVAFDLLLSRELERGRANSSRRRPPNLASMSLISIDV